MSGPQIFPNNTAQAVENGFLFDDWEPSEKGTTEETSQFDGKIIARMPDLGAESFVQNTEISNFYAFWKKTVLSIRSVYDTRQRFCLHLATFGCVVLLCGIMMLLLEKGDKPTKKTVDIADIISTNIEPSATNDHAVVVKESVAFAPILQPAVADFDPMIPGAPVENIAAVPPPPAVNLPEQTESVWNRPAADSHSLWEKTSRQSESPEVAARDVSPVPAAPSAAVAMTPMILMSMPISPYEQQLLAQASAVSVRPPVDPFAQTNNQAGQNLMPMHGRVENPQRVAPPVHPQYVPQSTVQGMHASYNQHDPRRTPQSMPIPSGVSTLPTQGQGNYYPQHSPYVAAPSVPNHGGEFYHAPPTYRRVY